MNARAGVLRSLDLLSRTIPRTWFSAPIIGGEPLDPFLCWLLRLRATRRIKPLWQQSAEEARAALKAELLAFRTLFVVGGVENLVVPAGTHGVACRRYIPATDASDVGLMVYFHGGGFVVGDLDTHDDICRLICRAGAFQVLSVDYRLAPEHPFPAALIDAELVTRWALDNARRLGVSPHRVCIGGDSAGAALATVTALQHARFPAPLAAQLLLYPPTDYVTPRPSWNLFSAGLFLSKEDRTWFHGLYLQGQAASDPLVSPLLAKSLKGVAPAIVVTGALDMLRDEGDAYARALADAGALAAHVRAQGLGHGFANLASVHARSRRHVEQAARQISKLLADRR